MSDEVTTPHKTRLPADYYSAPASEVRPVFPRFIPFGCGAISLFILIVMFSAGAYVQGGGGDRVIDFAVRRAQQEISAIFTKDVTPSERAAFATEMETLRVNLHTHKVKMDQLQPALSIMRDALSDSAVTPAEIDSLTRQLHDINSGRVPHPAGDSR